MAFYEVLDTVLDLLQRHGRVTYRALKRQYSLDDGYIEDLKAEIIQARRLAIDEDGAVLVWVGQANTPPEHAAPSPQPAAQEDSSSHAATPVEPSIPTAEHRQLTVIFCDLIDSMSLSRELDPEDLREVVRTYQEAAAEVIHRYEGHIAQYLGDGLLVYSGYPQAHEDDVHRAIRIGLGMVETIAALNARLEQAYGVRLAVRVGIHTGPVVVGEVGGGGRYEQLALGETPNIAARLEGLAAPNQVVISAPTQRLVEGWFDIEDGGVQTLKGIVEPLQVYGVLGERVTASRFEAATVTGLTPLVGREEEMTLFLQRWEQAKAGDGQVVLLGGELGIGKSRLVEAVRERITDEPHIRLHYQCSPYSTNSAFFPIITQVERAAQFTRDDSPAQKRAKLESLLTQTTDQVAAVVPLFAALLALSPDDRYLPLAGTPQQQKEQIIAALVAQLVGLAGRQPVMCLVEDVHWSDPSSLEVLDRLIPCVVKVRMLLVITYRPEFTPPWGGGTHVTSQTLSRLTRRQVATLVTGVAEGKTLPDAVLDQIVAKTDGVPLFVEELTKTVLESGLLREADDHYALEGPLPPFAIPSTLHAALMARLDRVSPMKDVAQIGACIGRAFSYELLCAIAPHREHALQDALHHLLNSGLLVRQGRLSEASYAFKHALVQETAYQSLLRSTRQEVHQRIAQVLETRFPDTSEMQPELLAHHFTEAGLAEQALPHWRRAGHRAVERSAYVEASRHLTTGLELLATLADTPERSQQELDFLTALRPALTTTKGEAAPELERLLMRAYALCQQLGAKQQLFGVLAGLWSFHMLREDLPTAREWAEECLHMAQGQHDPALLLSVHNTLGITLYFSGDFAPALTHLEQGMALYDPKKYANPQITRSVRNHGESCLSQAAWCLAVLGYQDQARRRMQEALTLARELRHPYSLAYALLYAIHLHESHREVQAIQEVQERAEELLALVTEHGFAGLMGHAVLLRGWTLAIQGQDVEGLDLIHQGLAAVESTGSKIGRMTYFGYLADVYRKVGQIDAGLRVLAEVLPAANHTELHHWAGELYRRQGELLLMAGGTQPQAEDAETYLQRALAIARHQQAKWWELRAARSLSRLWQQQGKPDDASELLAPIYGWFTEGFDTPDLREAKALLEELSSS